MAACVAASLAVGPPAPEKPSDRGSLKVAIRHLTKEAQAIKEGTLSPRARASFAATFTLTDPPERVGTAMVRRASADPVIDAYIRWQLTSFEPALPKMTDSQFARLLGQLPRLIENPRADRRLIDGLNALVQAGTLDAPQQEKVQRRLNTLSEQASATNTRNQPALRLREWLLRQLPASGRRALEARLERCARRLTAGWRVDREKADLERCFERTAADRSLTDEDRQQIMKLAHRLTKEGRIYVASARLAENALAVQYADTAVYDFDVQRWLRTVDRR